MGRKPPANTRALGAGRAAAIGDPCRAVATGEREGLRAGRAALLTTIGPSAPRYRGTAFGGRHERPA